MRLLSLAILLPALFACTSTTDHSVQDASSEGVLIYAQPFDTEGALEDFVFSSKDSWSWSNADGRSALALTQASTYAPPFRSPHAIALLEDHLFGDFILDVDVQQTGRQYGHRDLCLFFGFEAPSRFFYVHLATSPDAHAHNIFAVDEAARVALAPVGTQGVDWGPTDAEAPWHHVRLERRVADGLIRVWFDDMNNPVLETRDTRFPWGRVGFGSFDDTGRFANLRIWAPEVRTPEKVEPFR